MTSDEAYTTIGVCLDSLKCQTPHHSLWRAVIGQTLVDAMSKHRHERGLLGSVDAYDNRKHYQAVHKQRFCAREQNDTIREAREYIKDGWLHEMMPERTADRLRAAVEWSYDEPLATRRRLIELVSFKTKEPRCDI